VAPASDYFKLFEEPAPQPATEAAATAAEASNPEATEEEKAPSSSH
jgi:hypothetical protein